MTEFYLCRFVLLFLAFYPWKKIIVLLRVEAATFMFLVRLKFFHSPMGATSLTDLLSKPVCSETKREGKSDIKNNDLNCHQI